MSGFAGAYMPAGVPLVNSNGLPDNVIPRTTNDPVPGYNGGPIPGYNGGPSAAEIAAAQARGIPIAPGASPYPVSGPMTQSGPIVSVPQMPPQPQLPLPQTVTAMQGPSFDPARQLGALSGESARDSRNTQRDLTAAQNEFGSAMDAKKDAIYTEADLAAKRADAQSERTLDALRQQRLQDAFDDNEMQAERMAINGAASELRALDKEAADYKIDPERKMRPTGARILSAIAVGLGQIGASLSGGPNVVAQFIRQSIDDDIEAQRAELANKRASASAKRNELADMRKRFGEDEAGRLALRSRKLAEAEKETEALLTRFDSPMLRARAEQTLAGLQAEKAKNDEDFITHRATIAAQDRALRAQLLNSKIAVQGASGASPGKQVNEATVKQLSDLRSVRMQLEKARDNFVKGTSALSIISKHIFGTDSEKTDVNLENLKGKYQLSMTGAGVTQAEIDRYNKMFPSSSTPDGSALNRLQVIIDSMAGQEQTMLNSLRDTGYDVSKLGSATYDDTTAELGGRSH